MPNKKVELVAWLQNSQRQWDAEDSASCGARGCFSELSSNDIHKKEILKEDYDKRKEGIFKETSGRGHGAVLDHAVFDFSIDNLTRASTLFLCAPEYASHLQQSLRRATAERGFEVTGIYNSDVGKEGSFLMERQFDLYTRMQEAKIPSEDARFILPLFTKTTIKSLWDARELMHLDSMSQRKGVPDEVRNTVQRMVELSKEVAPHLMKDRKTNYEILSWFPSSQLYFSENKTIDNLIEKNPDKISFFGHSNIPMSEQAIKKAVEERDEAELANLKHYHFTFLAPMSLACFHQATRQRTWNQSVQTLQSAVERGEFVIPPSIKNTSFENEYTKLNNEARSFVKKHNNNPNSVGVLPHSLKVYDLIHVNGWNAIHSIGKRTCTEAQWEIRKIAKKMANSIKESTPELGKYSVPQGIIYGACPERNSCGICEKK